MKIVANRDDRDFGWEMSSRGRFATPADSPLHDCSPYRELHVRRWSLGFVHRSRTILCRAVPNPVPNDCPLLHRGTTAGHAQAGAPDDGGPAPPAGRARVGAGVRGGLQGWVGQELVLFLAPSSAVVTPPHSMPPLRVWLTHVYGRVVTPRAWGSRPLRLCQRGLEGGRVEVEGPGYQGCQTTAVHNLQRVGSSGPRNNSSGDHFSRRAT
jgi:hypothetical protein